MAEGIPFGITVALFILLGLAVSELFWPRKVMEGFEALVPVLSPKASYFGKFVPRRGDIAEDYDPRYFHDYADVQRLGFDHDFCRMVVPASGKQADYFFACALAGTENLSSTSFRSASVRDGFRISRDDYMRDVNKDGRSDYCRILKTKVGDFQAVCDLATDRGFEGTQVIDTEPPKDIRRLLTFYDGCVFWLRLRDDMLDYVDNLRIFRAGECRVKEKPPNPPVTEGLRLNGVDQFLRIGDNIDLELGDKVPLRSLRAIMVWVYFDEFTNNAKIFDFGNGAGRDNIFLGIVGRGDANMSDAGILRPPILCGEESTVPLPPSGPQPVPEQTPQELMKTTAANVDEYVCPNFELGARRLPPSRVVDKVDAGVVNETATLLYEIWDQQQRKMQIRVPSVIKRRKWNHIAITATSMDAFRPAVAVYVNGEQVFVEPSGFLPQTSTTEKNYIGKSNWANDTSQYENRDENLRGSLFDFRGYKIPLTAKVIEESVVWGREKLGLEQK